MLVAARNSTDVLYADSAQSPNSYTEQTNIFTYNFV